jgi:hypothetical protein
MSDIPPVQTAPPSYEPPQLPPGTPLKPGGGWYVFGAILVAVSALLPAIAVGTMISGFFYAVGHGVEGREIIVPTDIPGICEFDVPASGRYRILHQFRGMVGGEEVYSEPDLPGLTVAMVHADTGETIALHPLADSASETDSSNRWDDRLEMWWFEAPQPGKLILTIETEPGGPPNKVVFIVDGMYEHDAAFGSFRRMFWVMPVMGLLSTAALVGGIVIIIVVGVKRSRYRAMLFERLDAR